MTTAVEKVARAIYKEDGEKGWHLHSAFYLRAATAAIAAYEAHMAECGMVSVNVEDNVFEDGKGIVISQNTIINSDKDMWGIYAPRGDVPVVSEPKNKAPAD